MEIANIFPIKNQDLYKNEEYVMILAQLIKKYSKKYFKKNQYIILDNGLYEGAQVSTDLADLIMMAEDSGLPIKEIIIPDKFFDLKETKKLFLDNLSMIESNSDRYSFMWVAQSKNIKEFKKAIKFINKFNYLNLVVGIPKKAPFNRQSDKAIKIYKKCKFPIHFLGLTDEDPLEALFKVKDIVRSCDTSQICTMLKNIGAIARKRDVLYYVRLPHDKIINLEEDYFNPDDINTYLGVIKDEAF